MKKNLFFGLMALAGLFTSCSRDDAYTSPTEESNQVSMSIGMPADFVKTRAAVPTFPPNHTLRCVLEVWTQDGSTRKVRKEQLVTEGTTNFTFSFELADQGEYKAVLWADYIDSDASAVNGHYTDKYYKTDDAYGLKAVSISTTRYTYTDQVREAFTAVEPFTKGATAKNDLTATLVRPLTKVTIAEKNAGMFAKCTSMKATYTVPLWFDAFSQEVPTTGIYSSTYDATYDAAPVGDVISINGAECKILFSDYVFTAADGTMGGIELTFTGSATLNDRSIPANIPLKRNNWVRAAGNLITVNDPAVALSVDMTTNWTGEVATDIPDAVTEAKVGDYFYQDGTWSTTYTNNASNPCIGIVFAVNADGKSGKIVSLKDSENALAWATSGTTYATQTTDATDEADGTVNMATIKNLSADYSDFPAFKWCADKQDGGLAWYLPAPYELQDLYAASCGLTIVDANPDAQAGEVERWAISGGGNYLSGTSNYASQREAFKLRITAANGSELGQYLSSAEYPDKHAYHIACGETNGEGSGGSTIKTNTEFKVRAIAKFPKQ